MAVFDVGEHMVIDPEIMHGRLTFKGTRVPVSMVLASLASDDVLALVERQWPHVPQKAVREAIRFACEALHHQYTIELDAADDEARRLWDEIDERTRTQAKADARAKRKAESAAEFADP